MRKSRFTDEQIVASYRLGVRRLHLTSLFRLSDLSPQIVRAILNGQ